MNYLQKTPGFPQRPAASRLRGSVRRRRWSARCVATAAAASHERRAVPEGRRRRLNCAAARRPWTFFGQTDNYRMHKEVELKRIITFVWRVTFGMPTAARRKSHSVRLPPDTYIWFANAAGVWNSLFCSDRLRQYALLLRCAISNVLGRLHSGFLISVFSKTQWSETSPHVVGPFSVASAKQTPPEFECACWHGAFPVGAAAAAAASGGRLAKRWHRQVCK